MALFQVSLLLFLLCFLNFASNLLACLSLLLFFMFKREFVADLAFGVIINSL